MYVQAYSQPLYNSKTLIKLQVKGQQDFSLSLILGLFQNTLRISYTEKGHYFNLPVVKILGQDGSLDSSHIFQYHKLFEL